MSKEEYSGFYIREVPQSTLREIMKLAIRLPSWSNTQPWEFAIATGKKLAEIRQRFVEKEGTALAPDIPMCLIIQNLTILEAVPQ